MLFRNFYKKLRALPAPEFSVVAGSETTGNNVADTVRSVRLEMIELVEV